MGSVHVEMNSSRDRCVVLKYESAGDDPGIMYSDEVPVIQIVDII